MKHEEPDWHKGTISSILTDRRVTTAPCWCEDVALAMATISIGVLPWACVLSEQTCYKHEGICLCGCLLLPSQGIETARDVGRWRGIHNCSLFRKQANEGKEASLTLRKV